MNSYTIILGFALIAAAMAYGGSSYVKRTDHHGHHEVSHGHGGHGHDDHHDYHHHPSYKFEYGVKDPKTKDHHSQWEHRDGDKVHGEYTLDEADGTKRVVKYSADKHGGFTAHVERIGHADHPAHYGHHDEGHHY
jgi:Insect cuticle protein